MEEWYQGHEDPEETHRLTRQKDAIEGQAKVKREKTDGEDSREEDQGLKGMGTCSLAQGGRDKLPTQRVGEVIIAVGQRFRSIAVAAKNCRAEQASQVGCGKAKITARKKPWRGVTVNKVSRLGTTCN